MREDRDRNRPDSPSKERLIEMGAGALHNGKVVRIMDSHYAEEVAQGIKKRYIEHWVRRLEKKIVISKNPVAYEVRMIPDEGIFKRPMTPQECYPPKKDQST